MEKNAMRRLMNDIKILELSSRYTQLKTVSMPLTGITVFIVFTMLFYLSGCATLQIPETVITSIDQFPAFIVSGGPNIDPASDDYAVPDTDVLALSEDIKRLLDESVKSIKNNRQRLNALVQVINQNIRFDTSGDEYGTKTAIETFEAGSGNCLSFSNLFVSMARYVGLNSGFEEIPTPPNWIKDEEVLLFTRHIGATVDLYEPAQYMVNIVREHGSEKIVVEVRDKRQYLFAPLLPLSQQYTLNSISTRSISDNRAFAQYYNNIGSQYLSEGSSRDAFRYFVKSIKVDPKLSFVWSNLGVVYSRNNQPDAAEKAFLQALSITQAKDGLTAMTTMSNLARLYKGTGKMDEAGIYEEKVRSYRNMNPYYHYSMGEIALNEGRYQQSIEEFNEAIKRKSDDHQFYFALAIAYFQLSEMEKAGQNMDKAISHAKDRRIEEYYRQIWNKLTEG
jgi:tetratricopeptide (TPR) repeat protein